MNINSIIAHYNLGKLEKIEKPPLGGYLNNSFLVSTEKGEYFLQEVSPLRDISVEVNVLNFLSNHHSPGIKIIANDKGSYKTLMFNKIYILSKFIKGHSTARFNELSFQKIEQAAINLAQFHKLMLKFNCKKELRSNTSSKEEALKICQKVKDIIEHKKELDSFDKQIIKIIDKKITLLFNYDEKKLFEEMISCPKIFCHGDYHGSNLIFDSNDSIIGVVDWEFCGYDYRIWEVARSMSFICDINYTGSMVGPVDFNKALKYLNTYNHIFPLRKEEIEVMVDLLKYKSLCSCFFIEKHYLEETSRCDVFFPREPEHWFWWLDQGEKFKKEVLDKL